jgi:hypothetical protein
MRGLGIPPKTRWRHDAARDGAGALMLDVRLYVTALVH